MYPKHSVNFVTLKEGIPAGFCQVGRVTKAAELAGVHPISHYYWLKTDESYAQAFD